MEPFDLTNWPGFQSALGNQNQETTTIVDQIAIDSRRIDSPNALFVALTGSTHDGHHFISQAAEAGARFALVDKKWKPTQEFPTLTLLSVENPLRAFQEIARSYRLLMKQVQVIGVTGSYGKTMLKDLLLALLSTSKKTMASPESFNSQIGVALSLLTIKKSDEIAIIEAGISQKNEMETLAEMISPNGTILTNISSAHIDTLKSLEATAAEKSKLLKASSYNQWALIPQNDLLRPYLKDFPRTLIWNLPQHDLPHASYAINERRPIMPYTVQFPDGSIFNGVITSGFLYFLDLINIAIKAAWILGIPSSAISAGLKNYVPEQMRTEIWKSPTGVTFINDTYCSDPLSVDTALRYFHQTPPGCRKIFLFGGMRNDEGKQRIDYQRIGQAIAKSKIDKLILYDNHNFLALQQEIAGSKIETTINEDYVSAIHHLSNEVSHGDVVLIKGSKKEPLDAITEVFNDSICNNQCIINLAAIKSNIEALRQHLPTQNRIMVVVKATAYGTDDIRICKFLATCGIDIFGVSYVDEGVNLRRAGVKESIFVVNAAPYEAAKAVKWDFELGVSDKDLIDKIAAAAKKQNKRIKVHLHVDTGMSRFGCRIEEALDLARHIALTPSLVFEGIMTHFACAENPQEDDFTLMQTNKFNKIIAELENEKICPTWRHAANSAAAVRFNFPQYNMCRIGLATYGLYGSPHVKEGLELRLALSLTSRIVGINLCREGETISYGRSYKVKKDRAKIAVLPIGYFDGLHRQYSEKGYVIIRGQKAPMVGKICMDYMMVDVTDIANVAIGDTVLIFGIDDHGLYLPPEEFAARGNSIAHELITCLGPRIQRIFVQ